MNGVSISPLKNSDPKVNSSTTFCNRNLIAWGGVYGIIYKAIFTDCYGGCTGSGDSGDPRCYYKAIR